MKIYFATQAHNFQLRLCWQLSSILQQVRPGCDIICEVSSLKWNGSPKTEVVCDTMQKHGLHVWHYVYRDRERFAKRGYVRTDQAKRAAHALADFVFFADCDNVYHPQFFRQLQMYLTENRADGVISSSLKHHTDREQTDALVSEQVQRGPYVPQAFHLADGLDKVQKARRNIAGGGMQVVSMKQMRDLDFEYVPEGESNDKHLFRNGQRARSDIQFRKRVGGSQMIDLPPQIHLNHMRDKEEGTHIELQR